MNIWFIRIILFVTSGQVLSRENLLKSQEITNTMEALIQKANKILPFGLKAQKLVPFFIAAKLVSFAGFTIFLMNR